MSKTTITIAIVAALAGAIVAEARQVLIPRIYAHGGYRVLWRRSGQPLPYQAFFVQDNFNPETCLMLLRDASTGAMLAPVAVDRGSCDVSDEGVE